MGAAQFKLVDDLLASRSKPSVCPVSVRPGAAADRARTACRARCLRRSAAACRRRSGPRPQRRPRCCRGPSSRVSRMMSGASALTTEDRTRHRAALRIPVEARLGLEELPLIIDQGHERGRHPAQQSRDPGEVIDPFSGGVP